MRIQNNITAMNTHRQYTINNDNVAKSAEKLSSGYRINRAGDDAAGLAISEKMRSQIRGLNMATKNSQDAISLVQTAEGALQETHSMLQRMNELAVQAATGTNEDLDRTALAKEFEQLKKEINDVADQTTFNNMKILDGSLSYATGYQRSAPTAGMTVTSSSFESDPAPSAVANSSSVAATDANYAGVAGSWSVTVDTAATLTVAGGNAILDVKVDDGGGDMTISLSTTAGALTGTSTFQDMMDAGSNITVTATGGNSANYNITYADGKLTITEKNPTAAGQTAPEMTATGNVAANGIATTTAPKTAGAHNAEFQTEFIPANLKVGDTISIGNKTYELVKAGADAADGNTAIEWDDTKGVADLKAGIDAAAPTNITVTADGNKLKAVAGNATTDPKITYKSATSSTKYKSTIEIDAKKMQAGDKFTVTVGGEPVEVEFTESFKSNAKQTASEQMAKAVYDKLIEAGISADELTLKGSAITYTGAKVKETDLELTTDALDGADTNAMRIQVGALQDEQLNISIDAMNTKGLGLDGKNLDSQNEAGLAITAVRSAINVVSEQRATLGAMQNRLDHKIANLKVSSENLSAAESRIRDVDMASEMTNFTKNNILSQAATAMLAQANALPQNVLSLLG